MQRIIFFSLITGILATKDRKEELSEIGNYELIHFNFDRFESHRQLEFDAFGKKYKVQLTANENMIASNVHSSIDGKPTVPSTNTVSCHYFGTVLEPKQSADPSHLALSLCPQRGIRGSINTNNESMWIIPAAYYFDVDYDRNGLNRFTDQHLVHTSSIGYSNHAQFEEDVVNSNVSSRHLLGYNDNNIVELFLLSDPGLTRRYRDDYGESRYVNQLKYYVMDLINGASAEYEDTNWGQAGKIQFAIGELEIARDFTGEYASLFPKWTKSSCTDWTNPECQIVGFYKGSGVSQQHDILYKFREWVKRHRSYKKYDHYHELVGYKMYNLRGQSFTGGMCQSEYNMGVSWGGIGSNHDTVRTIAHEIGHNFGMNHDQSCSDCIMGSYSKNRGYSFKSAAIASLKARFTQHNKLSCLRNGKRSMKVTVQSNNNNGGNDDENWWWGYSFTADCIENTEYDQVTCLYNRGSLWDEHKEFIYNNECLEDKPTYQYKMSDNVSYALYYSEYYPYVDSEEKSAKWVVALDENDVLTDVANCDERDLMKCGEGNWKVNVNVNNDSLQIIVDETMSVKNGKCPSLQQHSMETSTAVVFVVLSSVLLIIILAVCGFFMYRRSKASKTKKSLKYIGDDSDDGHEEEEEEVFDIEVEVQQTNLTV